MKKETKATPLALAVENEITASMKASETLDPAEHDDVFAELDQTSEYLLTDDANDVEPEPCFGPNALMSLSHNTHSPHSGIFEIIDNAQEANATEIHLVTQTADPEPGKRIRFVKEIAVIDNGDGMSYSTLKRCLKLGFSKRKRVNGSLVGIGRFGVGLATGGIAIANRIEVYSRQAKDEMFLTTYLDREEMIDGGSIHLPLPREVDASNPDVAEYAALLGDSKGTIVILRKIWIEYDRKDLDWHIGRTYRKFIENGLKIYHNGNPIYLWDPLFMSGPTLMDQKIKEANGGSDLKATPYGEVERFTYPVPGHPGETADVEIRFSRLPEEWWREGQTGGSAPIRERKIHKNEGVSILRANREVFHGHISGLFGGENSEDMERWWGCEISFPPCLDYLFEVKYIKHNIVPGRDLKNAIYSRLHRKVKKLTTDIKNERKVYSDKKKLEGLEKDPFTSPEDIMSAAARRLKRIKQGGDKKDNVQQKKQEEILDRIVDKRLDADKYDNAEARAAKKKKLSALPLVISPRTDFISRALYYPEFLPGQIVLHLNIQHPFYSRVLEPLCGSLDVDIVGEDAVEEIRDEYLVHRSEVKDAIFLLLFSLAKGSEEWLSEYEPQIEDNEFFDDITLEDMMKNYNESWGSALGTAVRTAYKGKENGQ